MSLCVNPVCNTDFNQGQEVVIPTRWSPRNALSKAGRKLSGWVFRETSPVAPTFSLPKSALAHDTPSFISMLPPELLQEIFELYLLFQTDTLPTPGSYFRIRTRYEGDTTPMVLLHVCSSWRALAMSTSSLWSKLYIFEPTDCDLPLLSFWLSRSAGTWVDMEIIQGRYDYTKSGASNLSVILKVLQLVMEISPRWRKIFFKLRANVAGYKLPRHPPLLLEGLALDLEGWTMNTARCFVQSLTSSPHLRVVEWGGYHEAVSRVLLAETPWTKITEFCLGRVGLADLYPLLPHMTSIRKVALNRISDASWETVPPVPKVPDILLCLTCLSFGECDDVSVVLDAVTLPCLSHLVLKSGMGDDTGSLGMTFEALGRLVQRSGCRILALDWTHFGLKENVLIQALGTQGAQTSLQHLRHLRFGSPVGNDLIQCLKLEDERPLPLLESLELKCWKADTVHLQALAATRPGLSSIKRRAAGENGYRVVNMLSTL